MNASGDLLGKYQKETLYWGKKAYEAENKATSTDEEVCFYYNKAIRSATLAQSFDAQSRDIIYEGILKTFRSRIQKFSKIATTTTTSEAQEEKVQSNVEPSSPSTLESCIIRKKPTTSWGDVIGLETTKQVIKEAVILPLRFPSLFNEKFQPWKAILLYGAPGTGKSFLFVSSSSFIPFYSIIVI